MRLFVGLGNPGAKHAGNRHNIGFMVVEEIAKRHRFAPWRRRFQGVATEGTIGREKVLLLLPGTYMNESGRAVGEAAHFYKLALSDIVVVHDEIDLEFGRIQVKQGGGDAGHNGLRSIRQHLGAGETVRVRFGVGRPPEQWEGSDWVLARFSSAEEKQLKDLIPLAADAAVAALLEGPLVAANRYNRRLRKEPED